MTDEIRIGREAAKELRAEAVALRAAAKGAFAEARALVPWYQRRSTWLLLVAGIALSAAAANGGVPATSSSDTTVSESEVSTTIVPTTPVPTTLVTTTVAADLTVVPTTTDSISSGLGSQDATGDVKIVSCGKPDAIGFVYPKLSITNTSSKTSSYVITIVYESPDAKTKYDDSTVIVNSLKAKQSTTEEGFPVSDIPKTAVCKITEIQRTAS